MPRDGDIFSQGLVSSYTDYWETTDLGAKREAHLASTETGERLVEALESLLRDVSWRNA